MKTRTTIILCFVCASILAWYAPMPVFSAQDPLTRNLSPTVHRIVYQAQEALQAEKYGKAAEILREFDLKHPDKPDALVCYLLGNAYYMNNKKEAAYRSYRRGIEATTDSAMLWINLAAVAYELNHTSEAATYFRKAFDLSDPPDYDLLYQAGAAHYQAREYAKAKVALSELVRPQAKVEKPWLQLLIHTYLELGELKEAEEFLTLFLERNPTEAAYWRLMAQVRIHRKNYVEAAAALEIAYRLSPPRRRRLEGTRRYLHVHRNPSARCDTTRESLRSRSLTRSMRRNRPCLRDGRATRTCLSLLESGY